MRSITLLLLITLALAFDSPEFGDIKNVAASDDLSIVAGRVKDTVYIYGQSGEELQVEDVARDAGHVVGPARLAVSGDGSRVVAVGSTQLFWVYTKSDNWTKIKVGLPKADFALCSVARLNRDGSRLFVGFAQQYSDPMDTGVWFEWRGNSFVESTRATIRPSTKSITLSDDFTVMAWTHLHTLYVAHVNYTDHKHSQIEELEYVASFLDPNPYVSVNHDGTMLCVDAYVFYRGSDGWSTLSLDLTGITLDNKKTSFSGDGKFLFTLDDYSVYRYRLHNDTNILLPFDLYLTPREGSVLNQLDLYFKSNYNGSALLYSYGIFQTRNIVYHLPLSTTTTCLKNEDCQTPMSCGRSHYCFWANDTAEVSASLTMWNGVIYIRPSFTWKTCERAGSVSVGTVYRPPHVYGHNTTMYHNNTMIEYAGAKYDTSVTPFQSLGYFAVGRGASLQIDNKLRSFPQIAVRVTTVCMDTEVSSALLVIYLDISFTTTTPSTAASTTTAAPTAASTTTAAPTAASTTTAAPTAISTTSPLDPSRSTSTMMPTDGGNCTGVSTLLVLMALVMVIMS